MQYFESYFSSRILRKLEAMTEQIFYKVGSTSNLHHKYIKILNFDINFSTWALLFVTVILVIHEFKKSKRKRVSNCKIPTLPSSLPIIGPMFQVFQYRNEISKLSEIWDQSYGPIAKFSFFGQPVVVIIDPGMLQKLHSSTISGHLEKTEAVYSKVFVGVSGKGLFVSKVEQWTHHRKLLNKAFKYQSLKSYVTVFNKHADKLVSNLDTMLLKTGNKPPIKSGNETFGSMLHATCLEVISEIILGISLEAALGSKEVHNFYEHFNRIREIVSARFNQPWLLLEFIWKLHPYKKDLDDRLENMENIYYKVMEKRIDEITKSNLLSEFSEEGRPKNVLEVMVQANWSNDEILSEAATLLLGGHETISVALYFLFFLLATEPKHQRQCQEEIDLLFESLDSRNEEISIESLSHLKYLDRCVKEALRMFPTAPLNWRMLEAPLELGNDVVVDPGTIIVYSLWALHRNPKYYENPERFEPDRFLPENCRKRTAHTYLPFSAGVRNCIGWKMAMLEMTTIAAVILRHFDILTNDKLEDIKINFSFTLWPTKEPKVNLKRRVL